ncbi:DUF3953 domain-containing protein [Chitinophaga sp. CF118]
MQQINPSRHQKQFRKNKRSLGWLLWLAGVFIIQAMLLSLHL